MSNTKIEGLQTAKDIWGSVEDLYSGNTSQPFDVGFSPLEHLYKVSRGTFHVWTGVPNHGKSSFLMDIIMNMAKIHHWKFAIFSPEHSLANNIKRLAEKYMEKPFDLGMHGRMTEKELKDSFEFINQHFFFIDKPDESPTIQWILDVARKAKEEYNIDGLILDPYNEINPSRSSSLREDEHISNVISEIKRFNRETECVSWCVAHPTKLPRNSDGTFTVDGYSISGSAHWNNKADVIVVIERDYENERTIFTVRKVREADLYGQIGQALFKWNNKTRCFHSLDSNIWRKHN